MANQKSDRFIEPLHMNGLNGRMLRMPAPAGKKREILLLYGHHASLERLFGFAEVLNRYGAVTMPDLPGFGGMESFYKIHEDASLENYADYLAAFMKLRYKRKRVVIIGFSFSVPLVVRMLQKYPELSKHVEFVVSTVGFVHKEDFVFKPWSLRGLKTLAWVGSHKYPAQFISHVVLQKWIIRSAYNLVLERHNKLKGASRTEQKKRINFEVGLWKMNDVRTRMRTMRIMFSLDLCHGPKVASQLYHVAPDHDRYFNREVVSQHMQVIFRSFTCFSTTLPAHAPSIVARAKDAEPYIPKKLQKILDLG